MSVILFQPEVHLQLLRIKLVQKLLQLEPQTSGDDVPNCAWTAIADTRMKLIDAIERKCVSGTHVIARMRKTGVIPEDICETLDTAFSEINDTFLPLVAHMFKVTHDLAITINTTLLGDEISLHGYVAGWGDDDVCAKDFESGSTNGNDSEFEDDAGEQADVPEAVSRVRDMWERMCAAQQALLLKEWKRGHYFACSQD